MGSSLPLSDPGPAPLLGPRALIRDIRLAGGAKRRMGRIPGEDGPSLRNTIRFRHDPRNLLVETYMKHGPVFSIRVLHERNMFMIGPEANHFMLVSGRDNFRWRDGRMGDLFTLLGNGLLTTDGDYHDASRAIMMPSFHKERVADATDVMAAEARAAVERLGDGDVFDIYHWARDLAMRIAMQALFGFEPGSSRAGETADQFERGLSFHAEEFLMQLLVGPGTPRARLRSARSELERLVGTEIRRRRKEGGGREDILGSLLAATDGEGRALDDRQVLDHVMTLLFAGHDTTTSTVTFLFYELARNPAWFGELSAELDSVTGADDPSAEQLFGGLPLLSRSIDETLRLYPPAWIGPRRVVRDYEFAGVKVAAGLPIAYCSWASHRLPEIFPDPDRFDPDRFLPDNRAKLPRGAYVPFGMGPRVCIGKRFGYTEVHAIAAALLQRYELELACHPDITIHQAPTLSPRDGLPVRLHAR